MDNNIAIELRHVSKIYRLKSSERDPETGKKYRNFYALKDISFQIEKGHVVGILGTNGSGKSTLSLLLAEIAFPDEGELTVNGEQALVSISTGLKSQLTGVENIRLKGAMLGLPKKRIDEVIEGVIEFSEIGEFMYQPVKKYSSGMKSRLGFSINLCLDPDIMIIDEALSVGDKAFAKKCMARMLELKNSGKTIVFISHSLGTVRNFCDSCIWLEGGTLREVGPSAEVCQHYYDYAESISALSKADKKAFLDGKFATRLEKDAKKTAKKKKKKDAAEEADEPKIKKASKTKTSSEKKSSTKKKGTKKTKKSSDESAQTKSEPVKEAEEQDDA